MDKVIGAEGIIIQDNCLILGMQKPKRWYNYKDDKACIIKTIGGVLENVDNSNTFNALIREMNEEISNINNYNCDKKILFKKEINMCDLNPFDKKFKLKMQADFFKIILKKENEIYPNDLPCLVKLPLGVLKNMKFGFVYDISIIKKYLIISNKNYQLPKYFCLFIPDEVRKYFYE